jgi:hypothetical protein
MTPKVNYTGSFLIFWGGALGIGLYMGGLLMVAYILICLYLMHTHEHAHAVECIKRNITIKKIEFSAAGGCVNCGEMYANDAVPILLAGLKNTTVYLFGFVGLAIFLSWYRFIGVNYANNPYINLVNCVSLFTLCLVICNCLPISYQSKEYGLVSTDGWAAIIYREFSIELMNEGKYLADGVKNV